MRKAGTSAVEGLISAVESGEAVEPLEELLLGAIAENDGTESWAQSAARALLDDPYRQRVPYPDQTGIVVIGSRRLQTAKPEATFDQITDEDVSSSLTCPVTLAAHTAGVRQRVGQVGRLCGLPEDLVAHLDLVAALHDLGKADPRFQVMLHGGDEVAAAAATEPLAKSGMSPRNRRAIRLAFERSGLPIGYRHEAMSVALATSSSSTLARAIDPDLVLHLVGSHHGSARPFFPPVHDPNSLSVTAQLDGIAVEAQGAEQLARLDSGVPDRFWSCVRRYGWYGLAYLEAILRLADHRQSEAEAEERS